MSLAIYITEIVQNKINLILNYMILGMNVMLSANITFQLWDILCFIKLLCTLVINAVTNIELFNIFMRF